MFPFGEVVVLTTRTRSGEDADGNDAFTSTTTTLTNVPVWPRASAELVQGQDQVTDGLTAVLPIGTNVKAIDKLAVYGDDYEIDGAPRQYVSPFTGLTPGVEVHLKRVTG